MPEGRVTAIASAKGGVGKTTTTINLGTAAVATGDRSALLVEADLPMANVLDFLDLTFRPETDPSLFDVLAGRAEPADAIYRAASGLDVLPSGNDFLGYVDADPRNLVPLFRTLRGTYDEVLVDTGAGVSLNTLIPLGYSDSVVLVSTPRVSAIRDTQKTLEIASRVGGTVVGIVITQTGTGRAPPPERLAEFLGVPLLGSVPVDEAVDRSQDAGQAVVTYDPETKAARGYLQAADALGLTNRQRETAPRQSDAPHYR